MFRSAEVVKLFCLFHKDHRDIVVGGLQILGLVEFFDVKQRYPELDMPKTPVDAVSRHLERVRRLLSVAAPHGREKSLMETLIGPMMKPVKLLPKRTYEFLMESRARLSAIEKELGGLNEDEAGSFMQEHRFELLALEEELENALARMRALEKFGATADALVMGCWVEKDKASKVIRTLRTVTGGECAITMEPPSPEEAAPVVLRNPEILKPYEVLTMAYGLPRYRDIDPTPFLALTFTLFFGIMFADVGYGLVITAISLAVFLRTRRSNMVQRNLNLIILNGGLASIFFGFLLGEFMGGVIHLESPFIERDVVVLMERLILLALALGVIHISISVMSRLASAALSGESLLYPLSIIAILWSTSALALSSWEILPPWSILLAKYLLAGGLLALIRAKGFEALVEIMALFANIISYSRIAIILVLHVVMARLLLDSVYGLPRTFTGMVVGAVAFVIGAVLIVVMGVFITFIHSLRLHWLEFFKRFYSGMGESFKYFTRKGEYTYLH